MNRGGLLLYLNMRCRPRYPLPMAAVVNPLTVFVPSQNLLLRLQAAAHVCLALGFTATTAGALECLTDVVSVRICNIRVASRGQNRQLGHVLHILCCAKRCQKSRERKQARNFLLLFSAEKINGRLALEHPTYLVAILVCVTTT